MNAENNQRIQRLARILCVLALGGLTPQETARLIEAPAGTVREDLRVLRARRLIDRTRRARRGGPFQYALAEVA